eukprot:514665-Rhodomonas_salina.2
MPRAREARDTLWGLPREEGLLQHQGPCHVPGLAAGAHAHEVLLVHDLAHGTAGQQKEEHETHHAGDC